MAAMARVITRVVICLILALSTVEATFLEDTPEVILHEGDYLYSTPATTLITEEIPTVIAATHVENIPEITIDEGDHVNSTPTTTSTVDESPPVVMATPVEEAPEITEDERDRSVFSPVITMSGEDKSVCDCRPQKEEIALKLERLEQLESMFNVGNLKPDMSDLSLLELMYESAKERLFDSVSSSDDTCQFDLIVGKCAPACSCEFKPQLGDYSLSRMCRSIPESEVNALCDPSRIEAAWAVRATQHVKKSVGSLISTVAMRIKDNAPPSDSECSFSIPLMECVPSKKCVFDYQFGDYSIHRSCRRKVDFEQVQNSFTDKLMIKPKQEVVGT